MSEILGGISSLPELLDLEEKHGVTLGGPGGAIASKARPHRMKKARKAVRRAKKALAPRVSRRAKKAVARKASYRAKQAAKRAR